MNDIKQLTKEVQKLIDYSLLGKKSPIFISGTDATTIKDGYCIHFKEATIIDSITYDAHPLSDTLAGEEYLGGDKLFLKGITSITLTSGAVHVYEAK